MNVIFRVMFYPGFQSVTNQTGNQPAKGNVLLWAVFRRCLSRSSDKVTRTCGERFMVILRVRPGMAASAYRFVTSEIPNDNTTNDAE